MRCGGSFGATSQTQGTTWPGEAGQSREAAAGPAPSRLGQRTGMAPQKVGRLACDSALHADAVPSGTSVAAWCV